MPKAFSQIMAIVEASFQGTNVDGMDIRFEMNFSVAETMNDVSESDHLIVLAESLNSKIPGGSNEIGGKVAILDADYFTGWYDNSIGEEGERTGAHELGHLFGLDHESGNFKRSNLMTQGRAEYRGNDITKDQLKSINIWFDNGSLNRGLNYDPVSRGPNMGNILRRSGVFKFINIEGRFLSKSELTRRAIRNTRS